MQLFGQFRDASQPTTRLWHRENPEEAPEALEEHANMAKVKFGSLTPELNNFLNGYLNN